MIRQHRQTDRAVAVTGAFVLHPLLGDRGRITKQG